MQNSKGEMKYECIPAVWMYNESKRNSQSFRITSMESKTSIAGGLTYN